MTENSIQTRRQRGFTLIELISVIIILGILAAIVTPRYLDMTAQAQRAAERGVKSEAVARFNMAYSRFVLDNQTPPANLAALQTTDYLGGANPIDVGDYGFSYAVAAGVVTCTITAEAGTNITQWDSNTVTFDWPN